MLLTNIYIDAPLPEPINKHFLGSYYVLAHVPLNFSYAS